MKPRLIERLDDFVIMIQSLPYHSEEVWDKEHGIVRVYGKDGSKKKINYVIYPKKHYTKEYLEDNVMHKYDECPECKVGTIIPPKIKKTDEIKTFVSEKIKTEKKSSLIGIILGLSIIPVGLLFLARVRKKKMIET